MAVRAALLKTPAEFQPPSVRYFVPASAGQHQLAPRGYWLIAFFTGPKAQPAQGGPTSPAPKSSCVEIVGTAQCQSPDRHQRRQREQPQKQHGIARSRGHLTSVSFQLAWRRWPGAARQQLLHTVLLPFKLEKGCLQYNHKLRRLGDRQLGLAVYLLGLPWRWPP